MDAWEMLRNIFRLVYPMTFTSFSFGLFLPAVYLAFHFSPQRWRWLVLLLASYRFYASFNVPYLLVALLVATMTSYFCALKIEQQELEESRKRWFWLGALVCLSLLLLFKYMPFLPTSVTGLAGVKQSFLDNLTIIGLSYFTFQAIAYLADVYLEIEEPEHHLGRFALYMAFFPKLLQGPIERAGDLLPQLKTPYRFNYLEARSALLLFAWGFFKKAVLADRLDPYCSQVYGNVHNYGGILLLLATYAYALQIFFDFSGYTDMARGIGRLFGIRLAENFNSPYFATSIADFWRRWHMTFSRWILDYIFKPLQMKWRGLSYTGTALALLVTFLVSGLWHGASWGFLVWGLLHGTYLAASTYYRPYQKRLHKYLGVEKSAAYKTWRIFITFNLVSFAWIFFRAESISDAWYVVSTMFGGAQGLGLFLSLNKLGLIAISALLLFYAAASKRMTTLIAQKGERLVLRWSFYYALVFLTLVFGNFGESSFVYFKF
jgi:alginate O-acetyltransferase complex protein AlgI